MHFLSQEEMQYHFSKRIVAVFWIIARFAFEMLFPCSNTRLSEATDVRSYVDDLARFELGI